MTELVPFFNLKSTPAKFRKDLKNKTSLRYRADKFIRTNGCRPRQYASGLQSRWYKLKYLVIFVWWRSSPIKIMRIHHVNPATPVIVNSNWLDNWNGCDVIDNKYTFQTYQLTADLWHHMALLSMVIIGLDIGLSPVGAKPLPEPMPTCGQLDHQEHISKFKRFHFNSMHYRLHDDVIKWKHFPRYWPFVQGVHRSAVNSPHKGQWRRALLFSFICVWINGWVNNREAGDLRHYRAHYDVTVMCKANAILFRPQSVEDRPVGLYDWPAEPVKPVMKARRLSCAGTYSLWKLGLIKFGQT